MCNTFAYVLFLYYFTVITSESKTIPVIHNASLHLFDYNSTIVNGTCERCLCEMILNVTYISAFNCFHENKTCELFSTSLITDSFSLHISTASSVYFLSSPVSQSTSTTIPITATTITTATTIPNPCGIPVSIGSSSNIYSASNGGSSYTCYYYSWTASTTGLVTLAFEFQNNPNEWHMDDVSVLDGTTQMLSNGGFESGSFSPNWKTSTPNGACDWYVTGAAIDTLSCRTGSYCMSDGCGNHADRISQSFSVTQGKIYLISFWLKQGGGSASGISVSVTIS